MWSYTAVAHTHTQAQTKSSTTDINLLSKIIQNNTIAFVFSGQPIEPYNSEYVLNPSKRKDEMITLLF